MADNQDDLELMSSSGNKRPIREEEDLDEDVYPTKRPRQDGMSAELRLLLPSRNAGAIIGKGGENIKRLRQVLKASISIPDSRGPERLMIIGGKVDQICEVVVDAIKKMDKTETEEDIDCEIRFLIHQTQAGRIIGKGGSKIKELREESGAHVKVYAECCPQSMDRVAQLSGKMSQIIACLELIFDILDKSPIRGANVPYNPNNFDEYNAAEYGGYSEGRSRGRGNRNDGGGGGGGGGRGSGMGRMNRNSNQGNTGMEGLAGFSGMPGIGLGGFNPQSLAGLLGNMGGMGGLGGGMGGLGGGMGGLGGGMGGLGNLMNMQNAEAQKTTNQVSIPKQLAGAIIGKGGTRIREVQMESGTTIKIDNEPNEADERIISISGTPNQIQYAQYLLQMMVKRHAKGF